MNLSSSLKVRLLLIVAVSFFTTGVTAAQQEQPYKSITYRLSMSRPVSHLFEVTMEVELPDGNIPESVDFQMARWSPGRYAVFDFAKNVQQVWAAAGICPHPAEHAGTTCRQAALPVQRVDNQTWRVETRGGSALTFNYKVFGNDLSGTFSQLDPRHANFNGGSIFMYVVNHKPDPVQLVIYPPAGWRISGIDQAKSG